MLGYAEQPIRTALEIGAGTGKATRAFAARDIMMTATDPDAAMLAELRKHVPPAVVTVRAAFEDLSTPRTYDLVFAAAALHWTNPVHRWSRLSTSLSSNGVFASFGGQVHLLDRDVDEAVRVVRSKVLPDDDVPSPDGTPSDHHRATSEDRCPRVRRVSVDGRGLPGAPPVDSRACVGPDPGSPSGACGDQR